MNAKQIVRNSIIIFAITLSLFIVIEVSLRLIFPEKIEKETNIKNSAYEFNDRYLISLKPNIEKYFTRSIQNGGDVIQWRTNKFSFRGKELKENTGYRIIVYGDSNIQARFSMLENTFVSKLESYLEKYMANNVEVINAGLVGAGPDQNFIRFEIDANKHKPNLVIFHIFAGNDFGDLIRNRLFELDINGNLKNSGYKITQNQLPQNRRNFLSSLLIVRAAKSIFQKNIPTNNEKIVDKLKKITNKENMIYKNFLILPIIMI